MSEQQSVVIVGAAGGIGSELVRRLAKSGATLTLAGRTKEPLDELASEVGATSVVCDATDPEAVDALFEEAGEITGAVNLAGSLLLKPAHRTSPEEFSDTINASLLTAFNVVRAAAGSLVTARSGGSIVLMSSAVARTGMRHHDAIAAAKGGVEALARASASSYADKGIRVNAVAPGMTETALTSKLLATDTARKASENLHPMGTIAQPEEVASAIAWLLDPVQRVVTGQVLAVDAGLGSLHRR
ncbi:SDR family NAD(P)-dependent oxidoreductase [Euzebya tangerina]|uniref:SDR family NAD(P)-dependent oxidoreductase n=1 Tax=Euzebya tangerina TaxID=591198 RepID=UPI000E30E59D|nr:SDR family oxidoreductase [Euzebya tangerina]